MPKGMKEFYHNMKYFQFLERTNINLFATDETGSKKGGCNERNNNI